MKFSSALLAICCCAPLYSSAQNIFDARQSVILEASIQENPANITLNWVLDAPAEMQCELYDAQGRLVETLLSPTFFPSGAHAQELRLDGALPSGQYFLMVHVGDNRQVLRITKM